MEDEDIFLNRPMRPARAASCGPVSYRTLSPPSSNALRHPARYQAMYAGSTSMNLSAVISDRSRSKKNSPLRPPKRPAQVVLSGEQP